MNIRRIPASIWDDRMRIGVAAYDDQRKDLAGLIELLDQNPEDSNFSEIFLGRFNILQVVLQEYFAREEALMDEMKIPAEVRKQHVAEHVAIQDMFLDIYMDSMKHTGKTAVEVYKQIREALRLHFLNCDTRLKACVKEDER